jgi:ABC-2 type transport system permease protein
MRLWLLQLSGEVQKLAGQRRAWLGFSTTLAVELAFALCFKVPAVRAMALGDFQRAHVDLHQAFTGLTSAAHLIGEAAMTTGAFFIALIAGSSVAGELEDGTLRMTLCRPVDRRRLWLQKLAASLLYAIALTLFMALSSLAIGLLFEGPGRLWMIMIPENVFGEFDFVSGLTRYALASSLLLLSMLTIALLAFAASCFPIKPAAAVAAALSILIADSALRQIPALASFKSKFLMARIISWMHAFDDTVPWGLLCHSYGELLGLDVLLIGIAWLAFRRLELKP